MQMDKAADIEEIRQVLYRYCRGLDRMDRALVDGCFAPGATVDYLAIHRGTAVSFLDEVWVRHAVHWRHSHQMANVLVELDGDRAASETYVTVALWSAPGPRATELVVRGRYLDEWARMTDGWVIVRRTFVTDLRTRMHLGPDPLGTLGASSARDKSDPSYDFLPLDR